MHCSSIIASFPWQYFPTRMTKWCYCVESNPQTNSERLCCDWTAPGRYYSNKACTTFAFSERQRFSVFLSVSFLFDVISHKILAYIGNKQNMFIKKESMRLVPLLWCIVFLKAFTDVHHVECIKLNLYDFHLFYVEILLLLYFSKILLI